MKRRQLLTFLWCVPILLLSCRDPKVPSTPTVATGTVVDENNLPIPGIGVSMYGLKRQSVSATSTFDTDTKTDKDGKYILSYIVPRGTELVKIDPAGTNDITDQTHLLYVEKDGVFVLPATNSEILPGSYGKKSVFNYQYKKK